MSTAPLIGATIDGLTPDPGGQAIHGSIGCISACLRSRGVRRVLLVVDREALDAVGLGHELSSQLEGFEHDVFAEFTPNPTSEQGAAAARAAALLEADVVVAVGGGSCIDVAKIAALAGRDHTRIGALSRGVRTEDADPLPIIAAPTTAGTGSETTHFAAIYVDGKKVSVAHPDLRPVSAILDLRFQLGMPPAIAAVSGLDALCQAIESLWAVGSDDTSLAHAREAGPLIARHLEPSVRARTADHRRGMMLGAHLAGRAINISKTTASHALSYRLTKGYGLAHGHAVALTIGALAEINASTTGSDCGDPRGPGWVRERTEEGSGWLSIAPDEIRVEMAGLLARLGLPASLGEAGVPLDDIPKLADGVDPVRLGNNPRRLNGEMVRQLLERSWALP